MIRTLVRAADRALYVAGLATVVARELLPKDPEPEPAPEPLVVYVGELPAGLLAEVMAVTRP